MKTRVHDKAHCDYCGRRIYFAGVVKKQGKGTLYFHRDCYEDKYHKKAPAFLPTKAM